MFCSFLPLPANFCFSFLVFSATFCANFSLFPAKFKIFVLISDFLNLFSFLCSFLQHFCCFSKVFCFYLSTCIKCQLFKLNSLQQFSDVNPFQQKPFRDQRSPCVLTGSDVPLVHFDFFFFFFQPLSPSFQRRLKQLTDQHGSGKIYQVTSTVVGSRDLDLSLTKGELVATISEADSRGDKRRWLVDAGGENFRSVTSLCCTAERVKKQFMSSWGKNNQNTSCRLLWKIKIYLRQKRAYFGPNCSVSF